MKTTTTIITIILIIVIGLTACVGCTKAEPEVQEVYTEGYEVSSLHIIQMYNSLRVAKYLVAIRNDSHSAVVEVNEEMFASLTIGDVVEVEVSTVEKSDKIDFEFVILGIIK